MHDIHHFSYGWLTPLLAYIMSFTGSLLGLQCAARGRGAQGRAGWLVLAAFAIGGTGIWVMHFIAMLGFSISGVEIRYDVPLTLLSAATAIIVVGIGLFLVVTPQPTLAALLTGGAVTGVGVAAMHYVGMFAMKSSATIRYDLAMVALSVAIAVVAATVALWFTLRVNGFLATTGAAAIMGLAVCGMHYTGMASMHAHDSGHDGPVGGTGAMQLLAPLIVGISIVTMLLLIAVSLTSIEHDIDLPPLRAAAVRPAAEDLAPTPRRAAAVRPATEHRATPPQRPGTAGSAAGHLTAPALHAATMRPAAEHPATRALHAATTGPAAEHPAAPLSRATTTGPTAEHPATPPLHPAAPGPAAEHLAALLSRATTTGSPDEQFTAPPLHAAITRPEGNHLTTPPPHAATTAPPAEHPATPPPHAATTGPAAEHFATPPARREPQPKSPPVSAAPNSGTPYWPTTRDVPRRK
ncbi:MHYT domain-containing protein [Nocardia lijiangensis]|uniref:MHYT domain-containing protein n=1 Tax=Nocardia lijiangensis TaxID=299618 RepID=UPI000B0A5547|nr:MHYT domain-containing protein [Nocardia lijiangensis]